MNVAIRNFIPSKMVNPGMDFRIGLPTAFYEATMNYQDIIVFILVTACLTYTLRYGYLTLTAKKGCSHCSGCQDRKPECNNPAQNK